MKRKFLIVYMFIAFVLLCTNVYAAVTMDLELVPESNKVKQGSNLVVTVKLKNVSAPIASIEGYINVDENILEPISSNMIKDDEIKVTSGGKEYSLDYAFNPSGLNADYDVIFNTNKDKIENNDCLFVMDLRKNIQGDCEIMRLNFKVKEDATVAQATQAVKLKIISAVSGENPQDKAENINANLNFEVIDKNTKEEEPKQDPPAQQNPSDNKDDNNQEDPKNDDNKQPEKKELKGSITYSTTSETTGPVTATLTVDSGVSVTNNGGRNTYSFGKNGSFTFEFADADGNTGKATATVGWIKETPASGSGNNGSGSGSNGSGSGNGSSGTGSSGQQSNNNNTNTNTNSNTNKTTNTNKNDTTVAGTKIPKAGAGALIIPVVVCIVIGYVSYIKYLQYKEVK